MKGDIKEPTLEMQFLGVQSNNKCLLISENQTTGAQMLVVMKNLSKKLTMLERGLPYFCY